MTLPALNEALFWREDLSLQAFLSNFKVHDYHSGGSGGAGRSVPCYFRMSEPELRSKQFPYLLIDSLGPVFDPERAQQGNIVLPPIYLPDGADVPERTVEDVPTPVMLRYDVSVNTRFKHHQIELLQQMVVYLMRFGSMNTIARPSTTATRPVAIRDDMSRRRVDVLSGPIAREEPDPEDPRARTFRNTWTLGVSAEIFLSDIITPGVADEIVIDAATQPGYSSLT